MNKVFTLAGLCLTALLTSCNDGDIVYKDINFDKVTRVDRCDTSLAARRVFYKLNNEEALILQIDADGYMRDETIQNVEVDIDGRNTSLEYRKYNGKVAGANICNTPPPGFPNVMQLIPATPGGKVYIRREVSIDNKQGTAITDNNSVTLTYQYTFYLKNISFVQDDINMKYDQMLFGTTNYNSRVLDFKFVQNDGKPKELNPCNATLLVLADKEAMQLDLSTDDLPKTEGTTTLDLNDKRTLRFKQYERAGINAIQVCENEGNIPGLNGSTPNVLNEYWIATTGQVLITSRWTEPIEGGTRYLQHEIKLQNVGFMKKGVDYLRFQKNNLFFGNIRSI